MNQNTELMQGGSIMELPVLEIKNVHKKYLSHSVLEGVGFSIPRGKIVGLLGPNGCGKTTILKLISGLLQLDEGEIRINGICPGQQTKSMISYLPERSYLNDWMKISDILNLFSDFYADFDRERAEQMLTDLKISKEEKLKTMSKGTKEKVQLILVMSRRASLYLLDEPIGGVDVEAREHVLDLILENFNPKGTMLIVTHLIHDIERLFDDVIVLKEGRVETFTASDSLRAQYGGSLEEALKAMFREEAAR